MENKTYLIQHTPEEGAVLFIKKLEIDAFGNLIQFTALQSEAIMYLTYYEAAAMLCFIVEQIDGELIDELTVIER